MSASSREDENSAPILVTGATGNVGSFVVEQLLGAGQRVRAASAGPGAVRERFGGSVEAIGVIQNCLAAAEWVPGR